MKLYLRHVFGAPLIVLSFMSFSCVASEPIQKYPALIMHGETYLNACATENQEVLRSVLFASHAKDPRKAWRLIGAILCAPNDVTNRGYVKRAVRKNVRMSIESTGEEPEVRVVERDDELVDNILAAGRAWKANIRMESGKIVLRYFTSEACVEGVTLSFVKGEWLVNEFGVACD